MTQKYLTMCSKRTREYVTLVKIALNSQRDSNDEG